MNRTEDVRMLADEHSGPMLALSRWLARRRSPVRVQAIDHLNLSVSHLERSIDFYGSVFGFEVREDHRRDEQPWAILGTQGRAYLALYENRQMQRADNRSIHHWGFVVGRLEPVIERIARFGVPVEGARIYRWRRSRSAYVRDPDGHEIELVERFGGGLN